jgi:hypothetical protein
MCLLKEMVKTNEGNGKNKALMILQEYSVAQSLLDTQCHGALPQQWHWTDIGMGAQRTAACCRPTLHPC